MKNLILLIIVTLFIGCVFQDEKTDSSAKHACYVDSLSPFGKTCLWSDLAPDEEDIQSCASMGGEVRNECPADEKKSCHNTANETGESGTLYFYDEESKDINCTVLDELT